MPSRYGQCPQVSIEDRQQSNGGNRDLPRRLQFFTLRSGSFLCQEVRGQKVKIGQDSNLLSPSQERYQGVNLCLIFRIIKRLKRRVRPHCFFRKIGQCRMLFRYLVVHLIIRRGTRNSKAFPIVGRRRLRRAIKRNRPVFSSTLKLLFIVSESTNGMRYTVFPNPTTTWFFRVSPIIPIRLLVLQASITRMRQFLRNFLTPFRINHQDRISPIMSKIHVVNVLRAKFKWVQIKHRTILSLFASFNFLPYRFPNCPI